MPEPLILGNRSMDTVRRPLCGCFVLSCMVGGIFRKPLGFRRCLPPARPEKAKPFQAGRSPGTKHPPDCPALPLRTEKSFWGFQGAFFQKRSLGRVWDRVPQWSVRLFFYFLDCTDSFVYNLVPSTLKRKSFFRSFTGLLFRTFCFPSRRAFGSSVA